MEVIDIVRAKLPDPKPDDIVLIMHIEEVAQSIKTYCNRTDIPKELRFVHANIVVDFIKGINRKEDSDDIGAVSSIKEGDVTVQFKSVGIQSSDRAMQGLLYDYKDQLNRFRKLRW